MRTFGKPREHICVEIKNGAVAAGEKRTIRVYSVEESGRVMGTTDILLTPKEASELGGELRALSERAAHGESGHD